MKKWEIDRIKRAIQSCKNKRHYYYENRPAKASNAIKNEDAKIAALEKQIPQKIDNCPDGDLVAGCHRCGEINALWKPNGDRCSYCGNCGQAIDWSDSK